MGKRFYQGVGLLAVLLLISVFVIWGMHRIHQPAQLQLQQASQLALDGDIQQAVSLARHAHAQWECTRTLTAAVADHSPMDDVDTLFREMEVYAASGEVPHFASCCAQLSILLQSMYQAHSFTWWNVL